MADLGLSGAFGVAALQQSVRQRILEQLQKQAQEHQMGVEDQRLQMERDRFAQETADRALLRQQQGQTFNESLAEKTAANLGPNQTVISPELGKRFANTSLAPLVKPDETLPSTQLSAGAPLAPALRSSLEGPPTETITPGTQVAGTTPTITEQAPTLTGQLRFMGTPKLNEAEAQQQKQRELLNSPLLSPTQRLAFQAENSGLKVPANVFVAPAAKPGQIHDTAQGLVRIGDDGTVTPIKTGTGQALQGFHPAPSASPDDAKSIADAIESGIQPPDTKGLFRLAGPVRAELAKRGYDLSTANLDWQATQKHLATLNGNQQTKLRQAIGTATESLDVIQQLTDAWDGGRFPMLNKANLAIAKNGGYGKEAASIATQLEGQITDVVSELGNVYMGGNSPTDHALVLAQKNLSAEWDRKVLTDMIALARRNLQIRQNSIANSGAVTASSQAATPAQAPAKPSAADLIKKYGGTP